MSQNAESKFVNTKNKKFDFFKKKACILQKDVVIYRSRRERR